LVARPADWPYSSVHRFVRLGVLRPEWAAGPADEWATGE
jgi:putative transposase